MMRFPKVCAHHRNMLFTFRKEKNAEAPTGKALPQVPAPESQDGPWNLSGKEGALPEEAVGAAGTFSRHLARDRCHLPGRGHHSVIYSFWTQTVYLCWKWDVVKPALCCLHPAPQPLSPPQTVSVRASLPPSIPRKGPGFPPRLRASTKQMLFIFLLFPHTVQVAGAAHPEGVHGTSTQAPGEASAGHRGPTPPAEGTARQDAQT